MDHQEKKDLAQRYVKEGGDGVIVPTPELSQQQPAQKNDLMALMRKNMKDLF